MGAGLLLSFMYVGRFVEMLVNPLGSVNENTKTTASASSLHTYNTFYEHKIKKQINKTEKLYRKP